MCRFKKEDKGLRFLISFILGFGLSLHGGDAFAQASAKERRESRAAKRVKKEKKETGKRKEKKEKNVEEKKPVEESKAVEKESAKVEVEKVETMPKRFEQRLGVLLWQENIDATRTTTSGIMTTQSEGVLVSVDWVNPFANSHWSYSYGADVGSGLIKGSNLNGTFNDVVGNQRWIFFGGHATLMKRTSPKTSVGFELPVLMRNIGWDLKDNNFNIDREWSFTAGLSLVYAIHFSSHSLQMSIGNQYMWKSTVWGIAYQGKVF
ncbi:MAG: hypothetical protein A4S09_15070 [Proteobacteria bacterium SG_bin7]|nr:MAG: hypothetical protein A4S09_15070 [Proteobacteria bacterium SG_bin7]